ncbi:hypothetical protein NDU88_010877 [Pleurodeles waltl]|uniref:Uncharacterized protein n=1 Tax=Pleurodeles waltl TaxID=8319 RepID=A0AAV7QXK5_PLEWA|nr:hypothetical protein NDU88_010877 [Pleurodeles waltl]
MWGPRRSQDGAVVGRVLRSSETASGKKEILQAVIAPPGLPVKNRRVLMPSDPLGSSEVGRETENGPRDGRGKRQVGPVQNNLLREARAERKSSSVGVSADPKGRGRDTRPEKAWIEARRLLSVAPRPEGENRKRRAISKP